MIKRLLGLFALFCAQSLYAQTETYPYSFHDYQRINSGIYSTDTRVHTSLRPALGNDSLSRHLLDSVHSLTVDTNKYRSWVWRKLFNEHLIEIKKDDFSVFMDYLSENEIGRDMDHDINTSLNTRGYQIQGNIGKKLNFYTSGFENLSVFPQYLRNFIDGNGVIPGQVNDKFGASVRRKDYAYASALLTYTPNKYFSFTLGQDKNFIGDGYRSMILSDVAANYPFFKIVTNLGNVQYTNIWAQMIDLQAPKLSYQNGFRKKWAVIHYLDWNISKRFSVGFFESIIWQDADATGKRGFDVSYAVPIIFLRTVEGYNGSPDNAVLGLTGKFKAFKNVTLYGQFILDEFTAKELFAGTGYWANKFGLQAGAKAFNVFKVQGLNFLGEINAARPFTYSQQTTLNNYGHYSQPLAHPFGANFKEILSIWDYSHKRIQVSLEGIFAKYGLDQSGKNYGKNIFNSYNNRVGDYGNKIGQGVNTNFKYLDARVAYVLNPKTNLRFVLGAVYRDESNSLGSDKTRWVTFGLKSSFRNLYQDF